VSLDLSKAALCIAVPLMHPMDFDQGF